MYPAGSGDRVETAGREAGDQGLEGAVARGARQPPGPMGSVTVGTLTGGGVGTLTLTLGVDTGGGVGTLTLTLGVDTVGSDPVTVPTG